MDKDICMALICARRIGKNCSTKCPAYTEIESLIKSRERKAVEEYDSKIFLCKDCTSERRKQALKSFGIEDKEHREIPR